LNYESGVDGLGIHSNPTFPLSYALTFALSNRRRKGQAIRDVMLLINLGSLDHIYHFQYVLFRIQVWNKIVWNEINHANYTNNNRVLHGLFVFLQYLSPHTSSF